MESVRLRSKVKVYLETYIQELLRLRITLSVRTVQ
jgi:hypothetical protein